MQTEKEQCEVFAYFYSKCAELGVETAHKLVQFKCNPEFDWCLFARDLMHFPTKASEYRINPFYRDWNFEPFRITVKVDAENNDFELCAYTSEAVKTDLEIFGIEALDNMGIFIDGYRSGQYVIDGVLEIGPDGVHYTCTHKKL